LPAAGTAHNLAIIKIEKAYPGHAHKVMNSLWGAGQMMFNKVMIVLDRNADVHNYLEVARIVSRNCDLSKDILLSKGPLDILDHASGQKAFGGKMGIDATGHEKGLPGEPPSSGLCDVNSNQLIDRFPGLKQVNASLLKQGISIIVLAIDKTTQEDVRRTFEQLVDLEEFSMIRIFVFTDPCIDVTDVMLTSWYCAGNFDPVRDCHIAESPFNKGFHHLCVDGTKKAELFNSKENKWPELIVSEQNTIDSIDKKWDKLKIGPFTGSPSLKFF
ncbi:MAG: UbiD family decarboxylase, partial [Bacteroidetes bacterium]|nr:UbiD family decarboxylase [Bacteroidota bacterium]